MYYDILKTISINNDKALKLGLNNLPDCLKLNSDCGIITNNSVYGDVVFRCKDMDTHLFEVRGTKTPKGDFLVMFPCGAHYGGGAMTKVNEMISIRSKDSGKTWEKPCFPLDIEYNQHGFVPLIPKGSERIYCFGTQPIWEEYDNKHGLRENAPIGYFYSDDDGHSFNGPTLIRPTEDPDFKGMSVTRMCETGNGTWIIGSHNGYWNDNDVLLEGEIRVSTYQYLLCSEDKGKAWNIIPGKRDEGWQCEGYNRMDEGRAISLGDKEVLLLLRTPEEHLFRSYSNDDGKTWSKPSPTTLCHLDAPPMVFLLSDNTTLVSFIHNRNHSAVEFPEKSDAFFSENRSEIWASFSSDKGVSWSEPHFIFANVADPKFESSWYNSQCSYLDMILDDGIVHLFVPHLWHQVLHLTISEKELLSSPTKEMMFNL